MKQCFVISPIGAEDSEIRKHADDVFDYIIQPAMEACGIQAFRSDHLDKPGRISEQMFQAIFQSDLCVAVLTGYNPNVFYELAVAQSAQRPVIILIERGQALPFDVHDLRCVCYDLGIRSYKEQTHIQKIVSYIREYEAAEWKAADLFGPFRPAPAPEQKQLEFFESSGEYGPESAWLALLEGAGGAFDVMGVALSSWRQTRDFGRIVLRKASEGCSVQILLMHPDNEILKGLIYLYGMSHQHVVHDIKQNAAFFRSIAAQSPCIEVRQIQRGIPHFFLTRNDHHAVIIQYLSSQTWGAGPLWRCTRESKLYAVAKAEFDTLWDLNPEASSGTASANTEGSEDAPMQAV